MSQQKFRLNLEAKRSVHSIGYRDKVMLMGSCFSENMGAKFRSHKFQILQNPHGILFNPMSVFNAFQDYIHLVNYTTKDLFFHNEVWNCWHHHSRFSGLTQQEALGKINESIQEAHQFLKNSDYLVITLGSAWLYKLMQEAPLGNNQVVANNHRGPSQWFYKELMKTDTLIVLLHKLRTDLLSFNPHLKIIFTISPVRHLREGLIENNKSKAVLIQAIHELTDLYPDTAYFPAYEYVIDDLRDYRFYTEDLVHPNNAATLYVWEKWVSTYMNEETQEIMKQVAELELAQQHKPFFVGSESHQSFLRNCIHKTERLLDKYPYLTLQNNLDFFKAHQVDK